MRIFVSYASEDERTAEEVQYALQHEDHTVFLGSGGLPVAQSYHRRVRNEIESCDLFVFLISTRSVALGRYTLTELEYAKDRWPAPTDQVLPVLLERDALRSADPYLTALNMLKPKGNVAAETAAFVSKLSLLPPRADILLDECHGQATWRRLPPSSRSGYAGVGELLTTKLGLSVGVLGVGGELNDKVLTDSAVLILPIAPEKGTRLSQGELDAVTNFVDGGKGLLVMGTYTGDWHHEANLNEVIDPYGIRFANDSIVASGASASGHLYETEPTSIHSFAGVPRDNPDPSDLERDLLRAVAKVRLVSACSLATLGDAAIGVLAAEAVDVYEPKPSGRGVAIDGYIITDQSNPTVAAASQVAKVFVTGSWKMFLDPFLHDQSNSNSQLLENVISWLARS